MICGFWPIRAAAQVLTAYPTKSRATKRSSCAHFPIPRQLPRVMQEAPRVSSSGAYSLGWRTSLPALRPIRLLPQPAFWYKEQATVVVDHVADRLALAAETCGCVGHADAKQLPGAHSRKRLGQSSHRAPEALPPAGERPRRSPSALRQPRGRTSKGGERQGPALAIASSGCPRDRTAPGRGPRSPGRSRSCTAPAAWCRARRARAAGRRTAGTCLPTAPCQRR